jgi:glycosyltransferase involved in cell wall biosynthesis
MSSILFINRVYPPAKGATGDMLQGITESLAARGWDVTVLTTAELGEPKNSTRRGVRILRVGGALSRRNVLLRAVSYVFMIPWLMTRALLLPRTDFVVTMTDPPMLVVAGLAMKFFKRNRVIHWAQDLYPEVAEELGVLPRGNALTNLLRRLSTEALVRGDAVVAIGRCMASRLTARGVSYAKISIIPNWAPPIQSLDRSNNPFRRTHELEGQFVVVYSGNMGLAHEFDTVLNAAESLRGQRVVFLFIGEGPRRLEVEAAARLRGIDNIRFLPSQSVEKLSESLSAADAHLVTMRQNLCGLVVPSKVYGVLASGRPCLFVGPADSEAARLIRETDSGFVVEPGQSAQLASEILDWAGNPTLHAAACRKARIAGAACTVQNAAEAFEEMLRGLASEKP